MAALPAIENFVGPHKSTYDAYFNQANLNKGGIIGALDAASYLKKSGLPEKILGKIWDLSDPSGKGYLDKQGFFIALKLIAVAQCGLDVSVVNISKETLPPNLGPVPMDTAMPFGGSFDTDWGVTAAEKIKYDTIFEELKPVNGLLTGDKVKPVLMNSKLPVDVLGRVWELSDYDKDGQLDNEEFAVAMHLVYKALEKDPVPMSLPPNLIPPSKRKKDPVLPGAVALPGLAGVIGATPGSPLPWVVSPAEKSKFDEMFKVADTDKDGFVNGVEIKGTFLQSGLQPNVLAQIWNLCDMKSVGKLNSDQFALAMYLIQQKLKGTEPPDKLTPEMIPPSLRAPTLDGVTGPVTDFSTVGMKELDMIQKEIDDIKREKMQLEQERAQIEADIKIRNGEVQGLQKELDVINGTVNKLENQKGEAQKKLDELDDRKTKLQSDIEDLKEKCNEENDQILKLQMMINNTESTVKNQEEELKKMRDELNDLRKQESELEQKVEAGRNQLDQLTRTIKHTTGKMSQANTKIKQCEDTMPLYQDFIRQYQALLDGEADAQEPDLATLNAKLEVNDSANNNQNGQLDNFSSINGRSSSQADPFAGEDPFKSEDPFKGTDPFKSSADPFAGEDPFGGDGFGSKKTASQKSDAFGGAFDNLDVLGSTAKTKSDPFGGDPFANAFPGTNTGANDPFAPFGGAAQLTSPVNPADPFGTDPFNPNASKSKPPRPSKSPIPGGSHHRSKSPAPPVPSLPPKQKKAPPPPRPPAPRPGSTKPGGGTSPMPTDDPFGGFDPFGGMEAVGHSTESSSLSVVGGGGGFADFSPSKFSGNEEDQLAWATRSSQDDWEKQKRLQEQEQADLELAIKLSQQESQA